MEDQWIWAAGHYEQYSYSENIYINPETETAKRVYREFSHFSYHDDEYWDEYETIISIEKALELVYPNEYAISVILSNTKKDYSETLKKLAEKSNTKEKG